MKKCVHCDKKSLPGLASGQGLCQYHYNVLQFGREWADRIRIEEQDQERKGSRIDAHALNGADRKGAHLAHDPVERPRDRSGLSLGCSRHASTCPADGGRGD